MLSTLSDQPPKRNVPVDELLIDFLVGWCSPLLYLVAWMDGRVYTIFLAAFLGVPAAHFVMGNFRGKSEGILGLKALCICGPILSVTGFGSLLFVAAGLSIPTTVLGLWLCRRGWVISGISRTSNS